MSALARIVRGGAGKPRSSVEEEGQGERPPKKLKSCAICAGNPCSCPAEMPRRADQDGGGVIPTWRATERCVPGSRRDLAWPLDSIPQRPVYTATGGGPPGLIRVPPPAQPAGGRVIPTAVVNATWRPVEVPQRMLLPPQGVDVGTPGPSRVHELPLFEPPARSPSIESVCSSTGCNVNNVDDAVDSAGDADPYLDLDLKL